MAGSFEAESCHDLFAWTARREVEKQGKTLTDLTVG
jgi:hypothetical protein